jgi:hypothetical protein
LKSQPAPKPLGCNVQPDLGQTGRTLGGDYNIQHDLRKPRTLTLGQVTSRAYQRPPNTDPDTGLLTPRGAV